MKTDPCSCERNLICNCVKKPEANSRLQTSSIASSPVASGSQILLAQTKFLPVLDYWTIAKVEHCGQKAPARKAIQSIIPDLFEAEWS